MFLYPSIPHATETDGYFYRYVLGWLESAGKSFPWIYSIIAFILLYAQAMAINRLVNGQKLLPRPNFLPAMTYLLITSLFPQWQVLSAQLIMTSLLVWIVAQLSQLYNSPNARTILFNAGLALGLATLIYFPGMAFLLLVAVGLAITRPFRLPEWIITLVGLATPFYFYAAWLFMSDQWQHVRLPVVSVASEGFKSNAWVFASLAILLIALVTGTGFTQNSIGRLLVQSRKCWSLIYLYLAVALLMPVLSASYGLANWFLALVPASSIISAALFYPDRKWFAHVIHWGLVILVVVQGFFIR